MTYVVKRHESDDVIVVDPGYFHDNNCIDSFLANRNLNLEAIFLTHEHYDHIAGVDQLKNKYKCDVIGSRLCSEAIMNPKLNLSHYILGEEYSFVSSPLVCIEDLNNFYNWEGSTVHFHETQGHSDGSICIEVEDCLFTGDTLMKDSRPVRLLPGSNRKLLEKSIDFILRSFPDTTRIFPGHGESFSVCALNQIH